MEDGKVQSISLVAVSLLMALVAPLTAVSDPVTPEASSLPASSLEAPQAPTASTPDQEAILTSYVEWFFSKTNKAGLKPAKKLIPLVIAAAEKENLDPLLVAVVISCESSWKVGAVGRSHGEVGLMQLHGQAKRGFDVTTVEGNLAAGCRWLASRIEKYGSVERGVRHYIGFSERAKKAGTWRMRKYREAQQRHATPLVPLVS